MAQGFVSAGLEIQQDIEGINGRRRVAVGNKSLWIQTWSKSSELERNILRSKIHTASN